MVELARSLEDDLKAAGDYHGHLCAGQFIGVRMARLGCALLGLAEPHKCRELFAFVEIDRCLCDAVSVVTGCRPGKRRLKHIDYGKSAAVFANSATGEAVRISSKGWCKIPKDADLPAFFKNKSDEELFKIEKVKVTIPPENMPGPPLEKTICESCGEYITDSRQKIKNGQTLCKACADGAYYSS